MRKTQHCLGRPAQGLIGAPADQLLSPRVEIGDSGIGVGDNHGGSHAAKAGDRPVPFLAEAALVAVLCDGHLDGAFQTGRDDGFLNIPIGLRPAGAVQSRPILVCGQVDYRDIELLAYHIGYVYSVLFSLEPDVHEHEIR